ncbi:hypothetical protein C0J45_0057 [Silurus meridionalis]|nr:hypothetical protein C0J45_0057 [Silurus meridionalis]
MEVFHSELDSALFPHRLVSTETMQTAAFLIVTFLLTANTSFALISVKTEQFVNAECGKEVMLTCSIEDNLSLKDYYWSKDLKKLCSYKDTKKVLPGTKCEYVDDQKLVLTIFEVQPNNSATYTCKVKADSDHGFNNSNLHVSGFANTETMQAAAFLTMIFLFTTFASAVRHEGKREKDMNQEETILTKPHESTAPFICTTMTPWRGNYTQKLENV